MGIRAATVKTGIKFKPGAVQNIDEPYSHLAASIIIQAYDDLRALDGCEHRILDQNVVNKWEIINFFRSEWCGVLLSCQNAITQEQAEAAAWAIFDNRSV